MFAFINSVRPSQKCLEIAQSDWGCGVSIKWWLTPIHWLCSQHHSYTYKYTKAAHNSGKTHSVATNLTISSELANNEQV